MASLGHIMGPLNARRFVFHKVRGHLARTGKPITPNVREAVEAIFKYKHINMDQIDDQIQRNHPCPVLFPSAFWVEKRVPGIPRRQTDELKGVLP